MIILKIMGLFLWMVIVPFLIGQVPMKLTKTESEKPGLSFAAGYILMFAVLEIVGIPIVLIFDYYGYLIFCLVFGTVLAALSVWGAILLIKGKRLKSLSSLPGTIKENYFSCSVEAKIYTVLIAAVFVFQIVMLYVNFSMDADDFYFNSQALSAQQYGTMYRISPDSGWSMPLDIRHAMSLFPMWQAFVSSATGIHVTIVAHRVVPLILLPLSYGIIVRFSSALFSKKESALSFIFMINLFRIFGFVSYYTPETFLFLRTWQGKSFAGNFIIPAVILIFLIRYLKKEMNDRFYYLSLVLLGIASGAASSTAVMLFCALTGLLALIFLIINKEAKVFFKTLLTLVPGIVYMAVYVLYSGFLR